MGLIVVGPGRVMGIGSGRVALRQSLAAGQTGPSGPSDPANFPSTIPGLTGWWDAASPAFLLGPGGQADIAWFGQCAQITDRSATGQPLRSYRFIEDGRVAVPFPRISGSQGGVGQLNTSHGLLRPALDPDQGLQLDRSGFGTASSWTWYLTWTRPNNRQGSVRDTDPAVLIRAGATTVLHADSDAPHRLILFPSSGGTVLSPHLDRRHTHSLILRFSPTTGIDVWLDDRLVVQGVANPMPASPQGRILFLHDGGFQGGAQCWFHEAATWDRRLSDTEVATLRTHAGRWHRGPRKGLTLLVNGQSNAVNFSLNDGAAEILGQGIAWHLGAVAWNVFATTGNPASHTMQSGHGLYRVQNGTYPGNFLNDPMDGSDPASWPLGTDGLALQTAIQGMSAQDRADIRAIIWPWNETDSLRTAAEQPTFVAAMTRFMGLERTMIGKTSSELPLVCWSAIPYGTAEGTAMHRAAVNALTQSTSLNVFVGNPQTSDSNQRGAFWDEPSGVSTGGDAAHRDGDDNRRFARLAAPVVARAILAAGGGDSISTIPATVPARGGPRIVHAYRQTNTALILTVEHDGGSDLSVPRQAGNGKGFVVTDGGIAVGQGTIVRALHCARINATQLLLTLSQPLTNPSSLCRLHYPFGGEAIGRGNAVTDNFSVRVMPDGWDISAELGTSWRLDYPLSATFLPLSLSDIPHT